MAQQFTRIFVHVSIFKCKKLSASSFLSGDFYLFASSIRIFLMLSSSTELGIFPAISPFTLNYRCWKKFMERNCGQPINYSYTKFNCTYGICNCFTWKKI